MSSESLENNYPNGQRLADGTMLFQGKIYRVCGESPGLGVYPQKEGLIGEVIEQRPHCIKQWRCRNIRDCMWAVVNYGREKHHITDTFPESIRTR